MDENNRLAAHFEADRDRLRRLAYRMLGSLTEADDAVQEVWLRFSRCDPTLVENLGAWLTTSTTRICLDGLRARARRREEPLESCDARGAEAAGDDDLEQEAMLADAVGLALLVVLERLAPVERVVFVLHDMFDLTFEEIAPIVGRSAVATRQLGSRARRRVQGCSPTPTGDLARRRHLIDGFMAATRNGELSALLAVLAPDVILRADAYASPSRTPIELRGAARVARSALAFSARSHVSQIALIDGDVAVVVAPRGRLSIVLRFTIPNDHISEIEVVAEPQRLRGFAIAHPWTPFATGARSMAGTPS